MDDQVELMLNGQYYKKIQEMAYAEITDTYDINLLELKVLLFLELHKESDTAKDIVKKHFYTKSNVSKSIDDLIDRGYLQREHDSQDRRYIHLRIQPKAEEVLKEAKARHEELHRLIFEGVTEKEIQAMKRVAEKITQNIATVIAG